MERDHLEQCPRGAGRSALALLPLAERWRRHTEEQSEFVLAQAEAGPRGLNIDGGDGDLAYANAGLLALRMREGFLQTSHDAVERFLRHHSLSLRRGDQFRDFDQLG